MMDAEPTTEIVRVTVGQSTQAVRLDYSLVRLGYQWRTIDEITTRADVGLLQAILEEYQRLGGAHRLNVKHLVRAVKLIASKPLVNQTLDVEALYELDERTTLLEKLCHPPSLLLGLLGHPPSLAKYLFKCHLRKTYPKWPMDVHTRQKIERKCALMCHARSMKSYGIHNANSALGMHYLTLAYTGGLTEVVRVIGTFAEHGREGFPQCTLAAAIFTQEKRLVTQLEGQAACCFGGLSSPQKLDFIPLLKLLTPEVYHDLLWREVTKQ